MKRLLAFLEFVPSVLLLFMAFLFGWATGLIETGVRTQRIEVLVKIVHVRL